MTLPIPSIIKSEEEGRSLLLHYERAAEDAFNDSQESFDRGVLYLNRIRDDALYVYGGYETWEPYLRDFIAQRGYSRSLAYDELKVVRLASGGMKLDAEEVEEIGVQRLKPFAPLIVDYNRASGAIYKLVSGVVEKLTALGLPGKTPGEKLGAFIRTYVSEEDTPVTIRRLIREELPYQIEYYYSKVLDQANRWKDICWWTKHPDGTEEAGDSLRDMPPHVREDIERKLRISE